MKMKSKTLKAVFAVIVFFTVPLFTATLFSAPVDSALEKLDVTQPELAFWYELISETPENAIAAAISAGFGGNYYEVPPYSIGSRANRIIYFTGLTFWIKAGTVTQIRVDSNCRLESGGLKVGSPLDDVKRICGTPWLEEGSSLYYNLPWRGAPVRLRFVFQNSYPDGMTLKEAYLYQVN